MSNGLSMHFNFLAPAASVAFDMAPDAAIGMFRSKGLRTTFAWQDMIGEEHLRAFTVAKMMDLDLLATVRQAVDDGIAAGTDLRAFRDELVPKLQAAGWWGRQAVVDPLTGAIVNAQLGSAWRLETIFRTNLQAAYSTGTWQGVNRYAPVAPFLMYDAIDDDRTRPEHAQWDGKVFPVSSSFWATHFPPNGWNCRCGVIQLTQDQMDAMGLTPSPTPRIKRVEWTNPRTGKTYRVPEDLDPGWDYNIGAKSLARTQDLLAEKIAALPADMRAAAERSMATAAALNADAIARAAATAAETAATARGASAQSVERARARAEDLAAKQALNDIEETKPPYLWPALQAAQADPANKSLSAKRLLALVTATAEKLRSGH